MGGNALKSVNTRRVEKEEYEEISSYITSKLKTVICNRVEVIQAYLEKSSFGDLDVLVETVPRDRLNYTDVISKLFSPKEIVHNGPCYSFDYNNFQIDLILTPTDNYDTSVTYFAWNDLGNLMGRVFKKLGFKYGHFGLAYIYRKQDNSYSAIKEVIVSKDMRKIFEFGDFDYERFLKGFNTLEEIFEWVSSSKYFHKDIYLLHNRNHTSRTRDKKRENYNKFLKWCEQKNGLNEYPWTYMREQDGYKGDREFFLQALDHFEGFRSVNAQTLFKIERDEIVKEKFNGGVVSMLTGLSGKDLGQFMSFIMKQHLTKDILYAKLLHYTDEQIKAFVLEEFNNWKRV